MSIVWLCHVCQTNTEPFNGGMSAGCCETCGSRLTHFIKWRMPEEDAAARLLIERELALGVGGWGGESRAIAALRDAGRV